MNKFILLLIIFNVKLLNCQNEEFNLSKKGLIYSDTTMKQLKDIVDSLNLKYKACELNKTYLSVLQAKANYFKLKKTDIKIAKINIERGISFSDFIKKFPKTIIEKELLVTKSKYKNYNNKDVIEFNSIVLNGKFEHELNFDTLLELYNGSLKDRWIIEYNPQSEYFDESIEGFYFLEDLKSIPIPLNYAKQIQYSDCMIDTSNDVFYKTADRYSYRTERRKTTSFIDSINNLTKMPKYNGIEYEGKDYNEFLNKLNAWEKSKNMTIDSLLSVNPHFLKMLNDEFDTIKKNGGSDDEFEEYVEKYISKKAALELKRNRIVVGGCSMDQSPRYHAFSIAQLSAETTNWEIFLRAHLNIMNDRFDRMSDGSYAYGRRGTYIKELEELDLNVSDLLLGICLRIDNPSYNHYFGNIGRLGRAISESNKVLQFEDKMIQMITDNQLDDYNRILIYYLYLNYVYHLDSKKKKETANVKLEKAISLMPIYISSKLKIKKD